MAVGSTHSWYCMVWSFSSHGVITLPLFNELLQLLIAVSKMYFFNLAPLYLNMSSRLSL